MKKFLLIAILFFAHSSFAVTIANCQNPEGQAYFPYAGMNPENMAGWSKDKVTGWITRLVQDENGEFDIQFVDASQQIISSKEDGAKIILFAFSESSLGLAAIYFGAVLETYTFIKDLSGNNEYLMTQSKVGVMIPKAGVMRGTCSFIDFSALKKIKEWRNYY